MALDGYTFKRYEDLLDDELVQDAIELLRKRYQKMADWLEGNSDYTECEECGSDDFEYKHNGIKCKNCSHFHEEEVPYPGQGGVAGSRKLESCIKELFSGKMGKKRKEEKPSKQDLRELEFGIEKFDTGEYTQEEIKFIKNRYEDIMEESQTSNAVDKFYIRNLVEQELKIMQMRRQEAVGENIDSMDKKREFDVYNKLASKVKVSRDQRDNQGQESVLEKLSQMGSEIDIGEIEEISDEEKEKIEKSKKRMRESGNELV